MNQPTREEFDALKAEVAKLKERQTEPITIPRIELDPGGIQNRLDNHAEMMKVLSEQSDRHTQAFVRVEIVLREHTQSIRQLQEDVSALKTKVDDGFVSMEKRFDAIAEVQRLILARLPEKE